MWLRRTETSSPNAERHLSTKGKADDDFIQKQPWSPTATLQKAECRQSPTTGYRQKEAIGGIPNPMQQVPTPPPCPAPRECVMWPYTQGNGCFDCGAPDTFKKRLEEEMPPGNPDTNVVHCSLINIAPTSLENCYDVELADGKLVAIDTIIRGCTLNFLDHPFNIDLMPVELGSFDVIIGMDWLRKYHAVIVCDEKLVQVPYGNETLTFCGNESSNGKESRLTVISCSKAQEYMAKGCQVFLAQISARKEEDKSERKQIEDVPIVRDFPEVFPEDLPGLPPARPDDKEHENTLKPILELLTKEKFLRKVFKMKILDSEEYNSSDMSLIVEAYTLDSGKIESIKDWASPKTPTEIRQFLGLAGYYRRFIEGFSKIAKSMTKLTQKGIKFDWGEKEENAFQLIKQKLCSAPILALPEGSEDFVVYCDASHKGLGAVLDAEEKVIA
ncbi:putative reverse transcriptase domain-containing protein [Tanacetum coccineum]